MLLQDYFRKTETIQTKNCVWCHEDKPLDQFPRHAGRKDNLDTRCRLCIKQNSTVTAQLKKFAPPKPDVCDCCGQAPVKWHLDHDHDTLQFRGWLCEPCNTGIGTLGDTIEGLQKALEYLQRHELDKYSRKPLIGASKC